MNKNNENEKKFFPESKQLDEEKVKDDIKYKEWFEEMNKLTMKKKIKTDVTTVHDIMEPDGYMYQLTDYYGTDKRIKNTNKEGFLVGRYYFINYSGALETLSITIPAAATGPWKAYTHIYLGITDFYYANFNINYICNYMSIKSTNTAPTGTDIDNGGNMVWSGTGAPTADPSLINIPGEVIGLYQTYTYVQYKTRTDPANTRWTKFKVTGTTTTGGTILLTLVAPGGLAWTTFMPSGAKYYINIAARVVI